MFYLNVFLNFQNKVFVGDSGCYLITAILGLTFIYQYKNYDNFLFGDEVFSNSINSSVRHVKIVCFKNY